MFDLGWTEMMVIGIVALIVVGPKDLPGLFRSVGKFVGKAKGMAREFSSAMNAAADEAGVSEINKTIKAAANPQKFGADKIREATKMDIFDPTAPKADGKPETETDKLRAKMTDERKATAKKMSDAMAKKAEDRIATEKAEAAKAEKAEAARQKRNAAARAKRAAAKAAKEAEAPENKARDAS